MARRYRALAQLFVERLIETGEEFESDLPPGSNWESLDEAPSKATAPTSSKTNLKRGAQKAAA